MDKINAMMKHLLLISLICVLIGGGVAIAGIALGGTLGDASISVGNWKLLSPWPFRGSGSYQVDDVDTADAWTESADGACSVPAENITDLDIVSRTSSPHLRRLIYGSGLCVCIKPLPDAGSNLLGSTKFLNNRDLILRPCIIKILSVISDRFLPLLLRQIEQQLFQLK